MPSFCAAYGCSNNSNKEECKINKISFHKFPLNNKDLLKIWLNKIRREDFTPTKYSKLCSIHFEDDCFHFRTFTGDRLINTDAVPTIFSFTHETKKRKRTNYQFQLQQEEPLEDESPSTSLLEVPPISHLDVGVQTEIDTINALLSTNTELENEITQLRTKISSVIFRVETVKNDKLLKSVTGFSKNVLETVFAFLCLEECLVVTCNLSPLNQFFMFLVYLRTGITQNFLSILFQTSQFSVSKICNNISHLIYAKLKTVNIWPSKENVRKKIPPLFYKNFPNCRIIIDCTIQRPTNPLSQQHTFSYYKNANTLKALVGITPSGGISFISDLWSGSISDKELFIKSGLPSILEKDDLVLADKGFRIKKELLGIGCSLVTPHYLVDKIQFSNDEIKDNKRISHHRVHIERAICRIKTYKFFEGQISSRHLDVINEYFFIATFFVNFGNPLISLHDY